ncbi:MAG: hypothetical protein KJO11_00180 [Gemmatimonadetes bacterium]|nr:hypothetical protein [Gemmatimonadota bacterium]
MIRDRTLTLVLAAAWMFGGTGVVQAQEPSTGMMKHMGSMSRGAGAVLEHADALALTLDQVARLRTLRDSGAAGSPSGAREA